MPSDFPHLFLHLLNISFCKVIRIEFFLAIGVNRILPHWIFRLPNHITRFRPSAKKIWKSSAGPSSPPAYTPSSRLRFPGNFLSFVIFLARTAFSCYSNGKETGADSRMGGKSRGKKDQSDFGTADKGK